MEAELEREKAFLFKLEHLEPDDILRGWVKKLNELELDE